MNKVEKEFKSKAIIRGGLFLFSKKNAILFIEACQKKKIGILGIDGFILKEDKIQPSMENSIDFSSCYSLEEKVYSQSINFLNLMDEELFFEIVCSD